MNPTFIRLPDGRIVEGPPSTDLQVNFISPDWITTAAWLRREIRSARMELESEKCDDVKGHRLRGRIAFIKKMLAQEKFAGQAKVPHEAEYD